MELIDIQSSDRLKDKFKDGKFNIFLQMSSWGTVFKCEGLCTQYDFCLWYTTYNCEKKISRMKFVKYK